MNVLLAADIFPPESGGPATYAVALSNELAARGSTVSIVSLTPHSDKMKTKCPVYPVRYARKGLRYLHYTWLLLKHARHADLVYAMGPVNAGLPALFVARMWRKKFVVKITGDYAWEQGTQRFGVTDLMDDFQKKSYSGSVGILRSIESFVVRHADQVITPSVYLQGIAAGWGAKKENISVIYNAVEVGEVDPAPKPSGEQWIVSVGRLVPWKGMETLIQCMPEILKVCPGARLKIIGDGPQGEHLKAEAKRIHVETATTLLGNLTRKEALSYVASADVFVLNSGYEGLSHTLLEALSLDRKVLASNVGGNPEVILPDRGTLFAYDNKEELQQKIIAALQQGDIGNAVMSGEKRQAFLAQFRFATMIEKTKTLLEQICAS